MIWGSGLGGSGGGAVDSVNTYVGIVVLGTDDINEGVTNLYYTDARVRLALSASAPLSYNNLTGAFTISQAATGANGYLSSVDWNTFNGKQAALGFTAENVANKDTDGTLAANSTTLYPSQSAVKTYADAKVADAINNGTTTIAPSQNAVFDALALKQDASTALTTTLADGAVLIGNVSNLATAVTLTGDVTTSNAGVTAIATGVIVNTDISGSAAIDATKIADGTVTSTEFQYIGGLTSDAQTQLNGKQTNVLADASILVGNGSNLATAVAVSGDISLSNTGATAYAGTVPINKGGTGQTAKSDAFDALSPITTLGDVIVGGVAGVSQRLAIGATGKVLTVSAGTSAWMAPTNGYGNILWVELPGTAPIYAQENSTYVYYFVQGGTSELHCSVQVPSNYIAGQQIYLWASGYSPSSSNNVLMKTQATLIRVNTDSFASTTNQRTSTGVALTNVSANRLTLFGFDLTDSSGMINSVAVSACDIIKVRLYRDTDTDTADVRIIPGGTSASFNLT